MVNELSEISNEMGWGYSVIDDVELQLRGIIIQLHEKSEPLSILVNANGKLTNLLYLVDKDDDRLDYSLNSIKTQFAPVEIHITIVKLLRYIKKKYISDLEVTDEGSYWEKGDTDLLAEKINFINDRINSIAGLISSIPNSGNETPESLADKIEQYLKDKFD
ncbi:MAG: hypothetical protein JNK43_03640 [Ignavibacteria bacterium]|nr:hypothetical protein [Ignavibacteria bacterium]